MSSMSGRTGLQAAWRCSRPAFAPLAFAAFAVWLNGSYDRIENKLHQVSHEFSEFRRELGESQRDIRRGFQDVSSELEACSCSSSVRHVQSSASGSHTTTDME